MEFTCARAKEFDVLEEKGCAARIRSLVSTWEAQVIGRDTRSAGVTKPRDGCELPPAAHITSAHLSAALQARQAALLSPAQMGKLRQATDKRVTRGQQQLHRENSGVLVPDPMPSPGRSATVLFQKGLYLFFCCCFKSRFKKQVVAALPGCGRTGPTVRKERGLGHQPPPREIWVHVSALPQTPRTTLSLSLSLCTSVAHLQKWA